MSIRQIDEFANPQMIISERPSDIRSRRIADADHDELAALLSKGLGYPKSYFLKLFERLKSHPTPVGFPKYGYVLVSDGSIVGAILLIFSKIQGGGTSDVRCHVTSWYVKPDYRAYATVFFSRALKHEGVTYLNVSARPGTLPIIGLQGFSVYSNGQFVTMPLLHLPSPSADKEEVEVATAAKIPNGQFDPFERDLLLTHEGYGNISFWCSSAGSAYPFIFQKRLFKGMLPGAQLIYSRDVADFVRFVRPLALALASRGIFVVRIDSNGPIPGLIGKYFRGMEPRYYKGGAKPRLGDLTYTQSVMVHHLRKPNWVITKIDELKGILRKRKP